MLRGEARLVLEASKKPFGPWMPFADVVVERAAAVDREALRFRPFREGRGVRPRGFVHALRKAVYPASQSTRP